MNLSVVIPVYNEEGSIETLYDLVQESCKRLSMEYEIIIVDDGSTDSTFENLQRLRAVDGHLKVVRFRKNYGQTAAMTAGFDFAKGEIIVSMDGDLQNDPSDIPVLLSKMEEGFDVVCGWRKNRQDKFWSRRVPSIVANWLISNITGVMIHDNGCSLKAYRASVIKNTVLYGEMHRFIPAMSTLSGARITEIVVTHHPRLYGESKYGIGRTWKVTLDIILVKMITGFVSRPALWFGLVSFPFAMAGLSILSIAFGLYLANSIGGWVVLSTSAFLFLFLAIHLIGMGIIGELCLKTGDYNPTKNLNSTGMVQ